MFSPSIELLADKIDRFNEQYAMKENEKAVFSIEYAEFHWNAAENAGCLIGNRYGIVRVARDLMLTAAASGTEEDHSHEYATQFEDGSDEIIILKKKPAHKAMEKIQIEWKERRGIDGCEILYLENVLESMNVVIESFDSEETEPAKIEWSECNKVAFITGTAFGLVLLAREFIQFALSASSEDHYEISPLQQDGGRLVLVLRDVAEVSY